ncbi:hypothetical protein RJT34_26241 [Clitoria ternatea]|uniref:Uncharacterized protein n=1 Tax=Clitoria ternatea TaxID=43366 RepID=A0AAN9IAE3_CLITE
MNFKAWWLARGLGGFIHGVTEIIIQSRGYVVVAHHGRVKMRFSPGGQRWFDSIMANKEDMARQLDEGKEQVTKEVCGITIKKANEANFENYSKDILVVR